ncbi:aminotransferase class III-fold pyridoxal phosphate-dependent enzyme [Streptomyces sp. ISL-12]|uniref:aminotransferase class III-fold pyridoxal phosphate-dependent enzyme n=1 Tax=Streptomyces sp. ISL-12 TaxID=2819177 RepID=UPI0027DF1653|nr:aminotransferase class III-fold pyridoxal phosphate-dependent enzyme [Streptomyces sp. ISL-12]
MRSVREAPSGTYEGAARRRPARETAARTYARALPIVPVRARGLTVEGADGRRYLDCLSGAGTLALGHNHPVVLEAIREVLDSGVPLQAPDVATPVKDAFVDELLRTLPPVFAGHARVRFCGPCETDAMDTAVALVRAATGRTGIVPCGDDRPVCGDQLDAFGTDATPAGMLLAPVSDEGLLPVSDDRMRQVRRLTAARSVALIADERGTGVGRTGAYWAVDHAGVVPEVMVLSRAIGGSLPLSVVVHHEDLQPGDLGVPAGAFCGNQLAMAAGTATLAHVRENRLAEHAATLGAGLLGRLRELTGVHPCVGEVRGRGLMIGIEFVHAEEDPLDDGGDHPCRRPAPGLAAAVQRECLRRGLIVGVGGRPANVVRLLPPLTTTEEQAAAVFDRLADAVCAVARDHSGQAPPCPHPR